jgi:hypothetical protein
VPVALRGGERGGEGRGTDDDNEDEKEIQKHEEDETCVLCIISIASSVMFIGRICTGIVLL